MGFSLEHSQSIELHHLEQVTFQTHFNTDSWTKTTSLIPIKPTGGYASVITRSKSASSLNNAATGPETGRMLSDLDTALKASTNYIENHRSTQLPNGGHQEYHEYRSSTSSGTPRTVVGGDDYNLEKQVFLFCSNLKLFILSFTPFLVEKL